MKNFRIIPRLEIKSGNLIKGMRMEGLRRIGDPIEYAFKYYKQGADEIILDDIVASLYSRPFDFSLLKKIVKNIKIPIAVSGGIKNIEDIHSALDSGADKVCINTAGILNPKLIYEASRIFGSQCIVACIQGKQVFEQYWEPFTESGRNRNFIDMFNWIDQVQELGAGEIFFISIDHDGVKDNINKTIISKVKKSCSVPILIGGGIYKSSDIDFLIEENIDGCVISKSFHDNENDIFSLKKSINSSKAIIRK
tara:strand:+ start:1411 stop:2166 length:756 start_codon:yes stop_codon:yes gene_type:complete